MATKFGMWVSPGYENRFAARLLKMGFVDVQAKTTRVVFSVPNCWEHASGKAGVDDVQRRYPRTPPIGLASAEDL